MSARLERSNRTASTDCEKVDGVTNRQTETYRKISIGKRKDAARRSKRETKTQSKTERRTSRKK